MPRLDKGRVAEIVWPGVPGAPAETLDQVPGAPAATSDRPRGTNMNGSLSVWWSALSPAAGDARMSPRTVTSPPGPTVKVSSLGSAANAAADMDRETCTEDVAPAATTTLAGDTAITAPRAEPLSTTLKLYVATDDPALVSANDFWAAYAPDPGTYPKAMES